MYEDEGRPRIGSDAFELGVRPPGHPSIADVKLDGNGHVVLDGAGMSVFPSILPSDLKRIPKRLIPLRLADKTPGAAGDDDMKIWTMGAGPFASGPMTTSLALNATGRFHGTVRPVCSMSLIDFQTELARTQPLWSIEEP